MAEVVGDKIQRIRVLKSLSKEELAQIIGKPIKYIYDREKYCIKIDDIYRMSIGLSCHITELLPDGERYLSAYADFSEQQLAHLNNEVKTTMSEFVSERIKIILGLCNISQGELIKKCETSITAYLSQPSLSRMMRDGCKKIDLLCSISDALRCPLEDFFPFK